MAVVMSLGSSLAIGVIFCQSPGMAGAANPLNGVAAVLSRVMGKRFNLSEKPTGISATD